MSRADSLAPPRDYLKTYSLTCEPFANTLDGRFFYAGPALMQRLDLLTHLTQFGDSVILVSGPEGSGKTTLLGRFVAQSGRQWRLCLINADEFVQFRQRLGDALGIGESTDEARMLEQWAGSHDASQLLVIVIDNAQLLQPDALHRLCALLGQPEGDRARLILFGTPEAQQSIKQALDRKELPCSAQLLEIPRLSEEETAAYLMYRLAVAGYSGESPFNATEVRAICKAAEGRPAAINQLAHDALLEHQMRSRRKRLQVRRPGWMTRPSTWGLASLLVVGLAVYVGWERLQPEPEPIADRQTIPADEIPLAIPAPPASPPAPQDRTPPQPMQAPALPAEAQIAAATGPAETGTPDALPAPPPRNATVVPHPPELPPAESRQQLPVLADTAAPEETPAAAVAAPPAEADTPARRPAPAAVAPEEAATPPAPATQPVSAAAPAAPPSGPAPAARPSPAEKPAADSAAAPRREAWLLQQPAGNYSLQLLGSRHEDSMLAYIRKNGLDPARCAYYRGTFKGGDWFVLMYGSFASRDAALAARAALPTGVRKENPWPRSLASVQTAIGEAQ